MIREIFRTDIFMTRDCCGVWGDWMIAAITADAIIALAYFLIPITLILRVREVRYLKSSIPALAFAAFIVSCGFGHLLDAFAFRWIPYRLHTLVDLSTGIISIVVAVSCPLLVRELVQAKPQR